MRTPPSDGDRTGSIRQAHGPGDRGNEPDKLVATGDDVNPHPDLFLAKAKENSTELFAGDNMFRNFGRFFALESAVLAGAEEVTVDATQSSGTDPCSNIFQITQG